MTDGENQEWKPSFSPWIISLSVMLATFMEVLDTSVANVSLPHIAGSFSATTNEATWVLTSYLISNAIILPTTAWFSTFLGRKRFFIICIALFTISSFFCGTSTSLTMLIIARIFQGIGGGALQPISQAILLESFPPLMRGVATAVFGMGVVVAPIVGPTLGGWITDNYSWHWVFLINIPVGILAVFLTHLFVEDPPYIKNAKITKIDYMGLGFMALWLATLQVVLDKGHEVEWFSAPWLLWFAIISAVSFVIFLINELVSKEPIVNLTIFKNRNFAVGTVLISVVGAVLYGTLAMLPLFLQNLMAYPAEQSGLTITPRGVGSFITIIIIGRIVNSIDNRLLVGLGFLLLAYSNYLLGNINLEIGMNNIIWPNALSGVALGLIFIPLASLTFATLENPEIPNATGIFNLMRNIGGSVGISAVVTLIADQAQLHQNYMVSNLTPYSHEYVQTLQALSGTLAVKLGSVNGAQEAQGLIYNTLVGQANLWGFIDNFRLFGIICFVLIPLVLLLEKPKIPPKDISLH